MALKLKCGSFLSCGTALLLLAACSEPPIEEQGEEAIAEMEKEIEADARSLEEAADEAVKLLEAEIEDELKNEGVGVPQAAEASEEAADGDAS